MRLKWFPHTDKVISSGSEEAEASRSGKYHDRNNYTCPLRPQIMLCMTSLVETIIPPPRRSGNVLIVYFVSPCETFAFLPIRQHLIFATRRADKQMRKQMDQRAVGYDLCFLCNQALRRN